MIGHGHVLKTCPLSPQLLQNIVISTLPSSKLLFRFKQMSSQSASTNSDYGSVTRDASDITRQRKEFLIYNEKKAGSLIIKGKSSLLTSRSGTTPAGVNHIPAGNAGIAWIPYSNQFRLSYLFGRYNCPEVCQTGRAFNLNGPLQPT